MFRKIFNSEMEVFGISNCCQEPIYTPDVDGIGMCSYCGEWAKFVPQDIPMGIRPIPKFEEEE